MSFDCTISELTEARLVSVKGRVDSANARDFEKSLTPLLQDSMRDIILEMSALDYISSAGLRVILLVAKRARAEKARMMLCGLSPNVKEVFEISGFLKILDAADDLAAARGRLAPQ